MIKFIKNLFLFLLLFFTPQKKNLIVFGDRNGLRFADNSRYLFLYLNKKYPNKRCIWLTKNKKIFSYLNKTGFECYLNSSFKGLYFSIIAEWHIYTHSESDINNLVTRYSKSINLWHGCLFKKLKKFVKKNNNLFEIFVEVFYKVNGVKNPKYIVYPNNKYFNNILCHYPKKKYKKIISNLQRNIVFQKNKNINVSYYKTSKEKKICNSLKIYRNIIGYFPTWRTNGLDFFIDINDTNQLEILNVILKKKNSIILVKKHSNSFKREQQKSYNFESEILFNKMSKLSNFYLIDYEVDLNSILGSCDLLISDYSGVIFDYLFLNRPIILYTPDLKTYKSNPGLNFDFNNFDFGYKTNNYIGLIKLIKKHFNNKKLFKNKHNSKRESFRKKIFETNECVNNIINVLEK